MYWSGTRYVRQGGGGCLHALIRHQACTSGRRWMPACIGQACDHTCTSGGRWMPACIGQVPDMYVREEVDACMHWSGK